MQTTNDSIIPMLTTGGLILAYTVIAAKFEPVLFLELAGENQDECYRHRVLRRHLSLLAQCAGLDDRARFAAAILFTRDQYRLTLSNLFVG